MSSRVTRRSISSSSSSSSSSTTTSVSVTEEAHRTSLPAVPGTGSFSTRFSLSTFVKRVALLTDQQRRALRPTGFGNLLFLPNQMLSKNLLLELMHRWDSHHHSFSLPFGTLPISLLDVLLILGLPVTGRPLILNQDAPPFSDLEEEFGATPSKRRLSISSLERRLDSLGSSPNPDFIRTFLLFTIGALLFPTPSAKVDSHYLSFLQNLDDIPQFAWGAAVLHDVINWLDKRKTTGVRCVGSCLIFLQVCLILPIVMDFAFVNML